jgi:release factor glutamine methyltransferase
MPELGISLKWLIREGTKQLEMAGMPEPRRHAVRIWSDLRGGSVGEALLDAALPIEQGRAEDFQRAIQRRASGEPLAHATGWAGFRHLNLRSDGRALIPRPETEGLVELLLQKVRTGIVADVGTGSGCIALSLAVEGAFSRILGVDCSADALALARWNSEMVGTQAVDFVRGELCRPLSPGSLDALISNPPYLTLDEYTALDSSVRDWEPALALRSGVDGLDATVAILDEAREVVRPGGWLAVEVDCTRSTIAAQLARRYGWDDVSLHLDLFGRERYLLARRSETR